MNNSKCDILIRNLGLGEDFMNVIEKNDNYFIKRDSFKKSYSENAVNKIKNFHSIKKCQEAEDLDIYGDASSECKILQEEENERNYYCEENLNAAEPENVSSKEENEIFKDCSKTQIKQLERIFQDINRQNEKKVIVKAYHSKLKKKFYHIYYENSEKNKEKIKLKIFHKCNFPNCGRTFASSGWLKSHFKEHFNQLKGNKFNILFENIIEKLKI